MLGVYKIAMGLDTRAIGGGVVEAISQPQSHLNVYIFLSQLFGSISIAFLYMYESSEYRFCPLRDVINGETGPNSSQANALLASDKTA